ncbi:MAG: hypothetical protein GX781_02990 [Clostridiales bacterium]|nr:hypothetical protein [Clostridiales bacterium]
MAIPILMSKLHKPPLPAGMITRGETLKDSEDAQVILVSAQAGSGKTTTLSAWLSRQDRPACWYSLDDWDNDPLQFFAYLSEGLKAVDQNLSQTLKGLLDAYASIGFEGFSKALIYQLHTVETPFILALDDNHVIRCQQIHQMLRTLLEHFPPQMQLVIITREDPPLPLAKLRAGKRLIELRISDLRFTQDEVKAFFKKHLSVPLAQEQLRQLTLRTEGWAAGLAIAALWMQGLDDVDSFIEAFTGNHYYVMDYLMEEVLEHQPPQIKDFLLRTSILDSFSGRLCDALLQLEPGTSEAIIGTLVKTNSFIIPLDPAREWYRYHHLFGDLLTQRLMHQTACEPAALHHRAGLWYKAEGQWQQAIHHLLLANTPAEAAALIECRWAQMDMQLQSASWFDMAKRLPTYILEKSPVLLMGYGWALLDMGEAEACREWFEKALRAYGRYQAGEGSDGVMIADRAQFDLLPATISSAYAYIAAATGDAEGTLRHAQEALSKLPKDQYFKRSIVGTLLAIANWEKGDLQEAQSLIKESIKGIKIASKPFVENSYYMVLGELYIQQGALDQAQALLEQTISHLILENTDVILLPTLYLGLAKIAFLQRDSKKAYALLEQSKTQGQQYALMDWRYKYFLLLARVYCSEGLYDLARGSIRESKAHYYLNPIPEDIKIQDVEKQIEAMAVRHPAKQPMTVIDEKNPMMKKERANQSLPEPLTARELEVLTLLVSGLSNQEIANTLFLALSTVKGYNHAIFQKLGVSRQTQAILAAKGLGLA